MQNIALLLNLQADQSRHIQLQQERQRLNSTNKVHNFTTQDLAEEFITLLNKGTNFIPTTDPCNVHTLKRTINEQVNSTLCLQQERLRLNSTNKVHNFTNQDLAEEFIILLNKGTNFIPTTDPCNVHTLKRTINEQVNSTLCLQQERLRLNSTNKVHNFTNQDLAEEFITLLNKGTNFIPTTDPCNVHTLKHTINEEVNSTLCLQQERQRLNSTNKVHNFTNQDLAEEFITLLNKGTNFIPTTDPCNVHTLKRTINEEVNSTLCQTIKTASSTTTLKTNSSKSNHRYRPYRSNLQLNYLLNNNVSRTLIFTYRNRLCLKYHSLF